IAPIDARHQIVAFDEGLKPLDQFRWRPLGREAALGHAEHDPQHRIDPMAELALIFLELGDAGDVGKGDEHAVQCPVGGAIRQDAHQVMRLAVAPHDPPLAAFAVGENGLDLVAQIELGELADDVGQRPASVEAACSAIEAGNICSWPSGAPTSQKTTRNNGSWWLSGNGSTTMSTTWCRSSSSTWTPFRRIGRRPSNASPSAVRRSSRSPRRAIATRLRVGTPGAFSRYLPVRVEKCTISPSRVTTTCAGANCSITRPSATSRSGNPG